MINIEDLIVIYEEYGINQTKWLQLGHILQPPYLVLKEIFFPRYPDRYSIYSQEAFTQAYND